MKRNKSLLVNIFSFLIGAILASFPYVHIFLPREPENEIFGYYNPRDFWYDAGSHFTLLGCAIILLVVSFYRNNIAFRNFGIYSSLSFIVTGIMFSIKPFITLDDFPLSVYYISLFISSIILGVFILHFVNKRNTGREKNKSKLYRSQIKQHFVFNSLGSLLGLIATDERMKQFLM